MELNDQPDKFKFTKANFLDKFIQDEKDKNSNVHNLRQIQEKTDEFMKIIGKFQENLYSEDALEVIKIQDQIRDLTVKIRINNK